MTSVTLLCFSRVADNNVEVVCVRPTDPPNVNCDCDTENDCYTINEWIEGDKKTFINDTAVTLLAGVHLVNSTKDRLVIEDVHLLNFTGDREQGGTTVSCLHNFTFNFIISTDIILSHITFHSCTLLLSYCPVGSIYCLEDRLKDIVLSNVTIINGILQVYEYRTYSIPLLLYLLKHRKDCYISPCKLPKRANISDCKFQDSKVDISTLTFEVSIDNSMTVTDRDVICSCIQLNLKRVSIKDITKNNYGLHIRNVYNVTIIGLDIQNGFKPIMSGLHICKAHMVILANTTFRNNTYHSPMLTLERIKDVIIEGYCFFIKNTVLLGEGVKVSTVESIMVKSKSMIEVCNNIVQRSLLHFDGLPSMNSTISIESTTVIIEENTSEKGSVVILDKIRVLNVSNTAVNLQNNTVVCNDQSCDPNAIVFFQKSTAFFYHNNLSFFNNSASLSGGLTLSSSGMILKNTSMIFEYNEGGDGGAMAFYKESCIMLPVINNIPRCLLQNSCLIPTIEIYFHHNRARRRGGAIFIEDSDYINNMIGLDYSFFIRNESIDESENTRSHLRLAHYYQHIILHFSLNSAKLVGNEIYGGWIDISHYRTNQYIVLKLPYDNKAVTSNPTRICMCIDSVPVCNKTEHQTEIFNGQTFEIEAVAVGQRMGTVPSIVIAEFSSEEGSLGEGQNIQNVNDQCTPLKFTVYSEAKFLKLNLKAQDTGIPSRKYLTHHLPQEYKVILAQFSVNISLKSCPLGFQSQFKACSCLHSIELHNGVSCNYESYSIVRAKRKWVSVTFEHNNTQHHGVIVHDQCPYDFCRTDPDSLSFHLEFPDNQCAFSRSGVLCGACQHNLSQVLGTSSCRKCSNLMLFAVIPANIIAGILLVVMCMVLNFTVSVGTINGLIFYANIIRASQPVFFPQQETSNSFLSTFIAWLNLDLGIETCFYSGLDAYVKTWLQFVFPLYIWLMVITIIVANHYSTTVSRLTPNNALQVLATLFLLSYAKILRVVIIVFSSTLLFYPDGFQKRVWLYDGNIEFLAGKHIPLFVVTFLVLILFSVPYTLSLISIQWLQRISHYRLLFWVHRLMPLFDAYTGPYKHKHRYWTGLLLLVRVMILIIFTLNYSNNPAVNLLAIAVIAFVLQAYISFVRVYKSYLHNIFEIASLLNVGFLSIATFYQLLNDKSTFITTTISTSITFVIFVLIILYHTVQKLTSLRNVRHAKSWLSAHIDNIVRMRKGTKEEEQNKTNFQGITHTSIELLEKLIQD